jgi:hypothetical protein
VIVKNLTVVKAMYGIGMELTGKVNSFLGERTNHGAPVPFVLLHDNAWKWREDLKLKRDPVA